LVVEEVTTSFCGAVVRVERDLDTVLLEDRRGARRTFGLGTGFLLEGRPVILHAPVRGGPPRRARTASGSVTVTAARARVARASRIVVEGRHDAELVEKVWGGDLRVAGVVVELLGGICRSLGWPHGDQADIVRAWQRILSSVTSYADLEPALLGPVEQLIDFVTADA